MADFPANIWLRSPVIGGRAFAEGELTRATALLAQARAEVAAIETALGTLPKGSAADLAARLAVRHSKSGIPRGRLWASTGGPALGPIGWYTRGAQRVQIGLSGPYQAAAQTINWPTAYTVAPSAVLVNYVCHGTDKLLGTVQADPSTFSTTQFKIVAQNFSTTNVWGAPSVTARFYVIWLAIGGS
jgi:hypothetical protein